MKAQHLSGLFWSQWLAGDLSWRRRLSSAWHLRRCPACHLSAQRLRMERAAFAQSASFASGLAHLQSHQKAAIPRSRIWPALALAGSMAAVLLGIAYEPESATKLRAKGEAAHFALYVQREGSVAPLGSHCRPGDAVRASYQSTRPYLLVVEVDGEGHAQVVFPAVGMSSGPISAARKLTPGSWVLDDSPRQERFVALFSDTPLSLQESRACVDAAPACKPHVTRREVACSKD